MAKVEWTFQAMEDLHDISESLSQVSEKYANHLVDEIFQRVEMLNSFPRSGRIVPETNLASLRELIVKRYRIIYSVPNPDEVFILTVHHSAKPLPDF